MAKTQGLNSQIQRPRHSVITVLLNAVIRSRSDSWGLAVLLTRLSVLQAETITAQKCSTALQERLRCWA